jgi:DNA-binding beta-propeller fold protein YncE
MASADDLMEDQQAMKVMSVIGILLLPLALSLVSAPHAQPALKIECVAGCGSPLDGTAKGARLIEPFGVAFDKQGNWYICEYKGQKITKIDTKGFATLFAGRDNQNPEGSARGKLEFNDPHGLVISKDQKMYVADTLNHRAVKIDLKTGRAAVVAGVGRAGYSGDGGLAVEATFNQFYAVDINRGGDKLYITDLGNRRVRLLDLKSGVVTTIAGNGQSGVPPDGADAAQSPLVDPRAAAVDSKGNVYILERRGNALRIVDKTGKIRTVIAPGTITGGRAPGLNGPKHLCVDLQDNLIIADTENHLILKYEPKGGAVKVIAGSGEKGDRLITGDPLKTQLNRPHGVFVHPSGALYISDSYNHRVLKLSN